MTALTLAAVEYGDAVGGVPVAILHGLFGSARNWATIAQRLAAHRRVIALDMRNHGNSPWGEAMDYRAMAKDVVATLRGLGCERFALIGHSMGGKVAMMAALEYGAAVVERLIVVDIAPVPYAPHHLGLVRAMHALDLSVIKRRGEADAALRHAIPDAAERGFLLQNLVFEGTAPPRWRLNLDAIERGMPDLVGWPALPASAVYRGPALFVAGAGSDYVLPAYEPAAHRLFPKAQIARIAGAAHWVHAEQPQAFLDFVEPFLAG